MKTRHIRYSGAARWAMLSLLTLMGSSMGFAQEKPVDVTEQIGVTSVAGEAAAWTFTMPAFSVKADVEYYTPVASVTKNAGTETASTQTYDTFVEALIAADDGDVLTLCKDIDIAATEGPFETGQLIIAVGTGDHPLTLDLNGHTLAFPEGGFLTVSPDGYLKVTDGTEGGNGKMTSATGFAVWVCYGGHLTMEGGCVETTNTTGEAPYKSAIYNQGEVMTNGGTVSGIFFAIYNDGVLHLGEGKIAANQGFGVVGSSGQMDMLKFPEFDCMSDDIALNDGQLIYYGGHIIGTPKKKIKIYLENKEQKYFTYGYGVYMLREDGGITDPSDVFYVSGISDARIGFCSRSGNYYDANELEAGIANLTEVTFPAGNSTYYDERPLALGEWNDDLTFYAVTGVDTDLKCVKLTEVTSKRFGGHASLIVSNTSENPITVKMVKAACSMMENSFIGSFSDDLRGDNNPDEVQIYPYFEGANEAIEQIDKMDGFEYYDFNGEYFVPLSNLGPVEAHRCWLGIRETPDQTAAEARKMSVVWPGSAAPAAVKEGITASSMTENGTTTYTVDCTKAKIAVAFNNDKLTIKGVEAMAIAGNEKEVTLDYTGATLMLGKNPASNYVLAQAGNQATAAITRSTIKEPVEWDQEKKTINGIEYNKFNEETLSKILKTNGEIEPSMFSDHKNVTFVQEITEDADGQEIVKYSLIFNKTETQTHVTVMGATVGMSCLSAGNDFVGAAPEGLALASNVGADGVSSFAQMGGGSIRQETGARAMVRGADEEVKIEWGMEYLILKDCDLEFILHTEKGPITIESITFRRPGDANGDDKVNAVDLVEMINAKNGKASERFNLTNADIDRDGKITQDDIDFVVKLIMEYEL